MFQALYQYLIENQAVFIQGIGLFQLKENPAKYEFGSQQILPPSYSVFIEENSSAQSLQPLMGFVSRHFNVDEESAFEHYNQFCRQLQNGINQDGFIQWPNLGKIVKVSEENFEVQFDEIFTSYLQPVPAKRVIVQDSSHAITVGENETTTNHIQDWLNDQAIVKSPKDYWWIAALVIAISAIALIILRLNNML